MNLVHLALRIFTGLIVFGAWAFSIVLIGLSGQLLWLHDAARRNVPHGRIIFTICWSSFASLISFVYLVSFYWGWMWPVYALDVIMAFGFFASFAALTNWIHRIDCGRAFGGQRWSSQDNCDVYRTAEAIAFILGCVWLLHSFLSCALFHFYRRRVNERRAAEGPARTKKRSHFGSRGADPEAPPVKY